MSLLYNRLSSPKFVSKFEGGDLYSSNPGKKKFIITVSKKCSNYIVCDKFEMTKS